MRIADSAEHAGDLTAGLSGARMPKMGMQKPQHKVPNQRKSRLQSRRPKRRLKAKLR